MVIPFAIRGMAFANGQGIVFAIPHEFPFSFHSLKIPWGGNHSATISRQKTQTEQYSDSQSDSGHPRPPDLRNDTGTAISPISGQQNKTTHPEITGHCSKGGKLAG